MKRKQMMISFGAYDDDVYEFMQNNKNASALVRMLVRAYMRGENISPSTPTSVENNPVKIETVTPVESEKVEKSDPKVDVFDYSKRNTTDTTNNENKKKILELDL